MVENQRERLKQMFYEFLIAGESYARITEARTQAEAILGETIPSGSPLTKLVDEAMEAAVVRDARVLIEQSETTHQAYDRLVDLLERQPNLGVRSSTSVLQQAYSTPIPIAYLASMLAGINSETTVYEPTAGNGALLIAANPANVIANEINGDRFAELATRGYGQLTQNDATSYRPQEQVDHVICNPPFGSILDDSQRTKRFLLHDTWTTQIDHIIAFNALEVMRDNGRAVLILGGKLGSDEERRSDRYNTRESRAFYHLLYNHYKVIQHFSIWGDLYRKQGAGFPIDVIVIEGRGKSQRLLPAAEVPAIYRSFAELKELLSNEPISRLSQGVGYSLSGIAVRGEDPGSDQHFRRADLHSLNATTSQLVNSTLDGRRRQYPNRDTATAGESTQRITSFSRSSSTEPEQRREAIDLKEWRDSWAATFILYNERFSEALSLQGANFPVQPLTEAHSEFQRLMEIHQDTHLEEWLLQLSP